MIGCWPPDTMGLVKALLGPNASDATALAVLDRSAYLRTCALQTLSQSFSDDPEHPYRRAAAMLGSHYSDHIAGNIRPLSDDADLDTLGTVRSMRGRLGGTEVVFVSPTLEQLISLRQRVQEDPTLAERLCIVSPSTMRTGLVEANEHLFYTSALQRLARRFPSGSAHLDLSFRIRFGVVLAIATILLASSLAIPIVQPVVLGFLSLMLTVPSFFRFWAAGGYRPDARLKPKIELGDADLPIYTVLIPLRDEAHMVPQIAVAMRRLDYPVEKLDIIFVVESASPETIAEVQGQLHDQRFSLIVVPKGPPFTKPKALNYALPMARGVHVVVYDAEDVPEPSQLRRAASLFAEDSELECLQAELVIAPSSRGFVARMFAAEYAGHFGVLLPAISRARLPMPLGGTSNHFRTETLRQIGAWDASNVTEDADLGIRMARLGLKVENVASITWEEAPETVSEWVRQRSRWMKGWMQTLIVHSAHPLSLARDLGWKGVFAFYIFVGGMVLSTAMHAIFLTTTLVLVLIGALTQGMPSPWVFAGLASLLVGYGGAAALSVVGLERLRRRGAVMAVFGLPIYWLLAALALTIAMRDLLVRPHHWAKTNHKGFPDGLPTDGVPLKPLPARIAIDGEYAD